MNKPRLIDANELKKQYTDAFVSAYGKEAASMFIGVINQMPTAYDIDEVIKKLESNSWKSPKEPHKLMWLDRAIEIVKGGAE